MNKISSEDRSNLIRLASELPKGSEERRAILSGLSKVGMEFATKDALDDYLKDHPGADKSLHSVKKTEKKPSKAEQEKEVDEEYEKQKGEREEGQKRNKGISDFPSKEDWLKSPAYKKPKDLKKDKKRRDDAQKKYDTESSGQLNRFNR